jgi:hypothetical protein
MNNLYVKVMNCTRSIRVWREHLLCTELQRDTDQRVDQKSETLVTDRHTANFRLGR